jgi:nitroreductase
MRGYPDVQSIGAAIEHLLLAATELGYGSCWHSGPLIAREPLLGIAAPDHLAALVTIGVPAVPPNEGRDRRPVDEILRFLD